MQDFFRVCKSIKPPWMKHTLVVWLTVKGDQSPTTTAFSIEIIRPRKISFTAASTACDTPRV